MAEMKNAAVWLWMSWAFSRAKKWPSWVQEFQSDAVIAFSKMSTWRMAHLTYSLKLVLILLIPACIQAQNYSLATLDSMYNSGHSQKYIHDWVVEQVYVLMGNGDFEGASNLFGYGTELSLRLKNFDLATQYILENGEMYSMTTDYDRALELMEPIESWKIGDEMMITFLAAKGGALQNVQENEQAEIVLLKALNLINSTGLDTQKDVVYISLSELAKAQGEFVQAIDYSLKALEAYKDKPVSWYYRNILINIAELFISVGNDKRAEQYLRENLNLLADDSPIMNSYIYRDLGRIHRTRNNLDSAKYYFKRMRNSISQSKFSRQFRSSDIYLADCYIREGNIDSAKVLLYGGNSSTEFEPASSMKLNFTSVEAKIHRAEGDLYKAKDAINSVLFVAEEKNLPLFYVQALKTAALIAKDLKDDDEYQRLVSQAQIIEDSLFQINASHEIHNREADFNEEQQRIAMERMEKLDEQRKKQIRLYSLISVGLLGLATLLFFLFRNNKRKSELLSQKNDQISAVLSEKEVLLKEVHHRVKNNLQIVSSLLRMQSRDLNDPTAKAALKESENRIYSMALIHQDLYQEDDLRGIFMPDYVDNLIDNILNGMGHQDKRVEWTKNIEAINLDIDTVIPIGLIINELLTNSMKYAFQDETNPQITVSLFEKDNLLHLVVADNGNGKSVKSKDSTGMGTKIISALSKKLRGEMRIDKSNGYKTEFEFSKYNKVL